MRILEPDWTGLESVTSGFEQALKETNATHLVVGEFVRRGNKLRVSVRLIDVDTGLIIATARGFVHVDELSDRARRAALDLPAASGSGPGLDPPIFVAASVRRDSPAAPETPSLANSSSPAAQPVAQASVPDESAPRGPARQRSEAERLPPRTGPAFFRWSARGGARRR